MIEQGPMIVNATARIHWLCSVAQVFLRLCAHCKKGSSKRVRQVDSAFQGQVRPQPEMLVTEGQPLASEIWLQAEHALGVFTYIQVGVS